MSASVFSPEVTMLTVFFCGLAFLAGAYAERRFKVLDYIRANID